MPPRFGAAISQHPTAASAIGEVVGSMLEDVGEGTDLVCCFVTPHFDGALEDVAGALHAFLDPKAMIGAVATGVIGPNQIVTDGPGISVWAGDVGPVAPVRLQVTDLPTGGRAIAGWPARNPWVPAGAVLLADPSTFPVDPLLAALNRAGGFPRLTGGLIAAAAGAHRTRFILDGDIVEDGAVGVLIGASEEVWLEPIVAPGARPIGKPYVVTSAEGNVIRELGGMRALDRLQQLVESSLDEEELSLVANGILVGRAIDEHEVDYAPDDFLMRSLLSADDDGIVVGDAVPVGTTVQFQAPDHHWATSELARRLPVERPFGGLVFSEPRRASPSSGDGDGEDDASTIDEHLPGLPIAGCCTTAQLGVARGRNHIHGMSASIAMFGPPRTTKAAGASPPAISEEDEPQAAPEH